MSLRKTILLIFVSLTLNQLASASASQSSASISWAGNSEAHIAGYRVYYRTAFENAPQAIDVGNSTSIVLKNLIPETKYFCRLTAYNVFGLESPPSPEIVLFGSPNAPILQASTDGLLFKIAGKPGGTVDLYESTDLKRWSHVRTIVNPTGYIEVTEEYDPSEPRKFFSLRTSGDTLTGWLSQEEQPDPRAPYRGTSINNQFAYSVGADLAGGYPNVQPTLGTVTMPWGDRTETFATFNFTIREGTRDVKPLVEISHDLKLWSQDDSRLVDAGSKLNGNGTRTISLRESLPVSQNVHRSTYYRLRFDDAPSPSP